jgi:hypothetical protein
MRRIVAAAVVALAFLGGGGVSRPDASSAPVRLAGAKPGGPLVGIVQQNGTSKLARIEPRSLRPLRGRRVPAPGAWTWAFSPNRSRVVLGLSREGRTLPRSSLCFVDVRRLRTVADVPLGVGGVNRLAWLTPDRLLVVQHLCCGGTFDLVIVAPRARRVVERRTLEGEPLHIATTRDELVVLVAPPDRIGPSQLLVVDPEGRTRWAALPQVWAGREVSDEMTEPFVARHRYPGLTADPDGRRAFVVSTDGSVASVDLQSFKVAYHTPSKPRSLLGRLQNWLEPEAHAKASDGPMRDALWLGSGLLAVTGSDDHTFTGADGALSMRTDPVGLSLIDTNTWTVRRIDDSVSHVSRVGNLLFATGYSWDSSTQRPGGFGLAGYTLDGSKRFHVFEDRFLTQLRIYGGRAYVGLEGTVRVGAAWRRLDDGSAFKTVDLATGQIIGTRTAPLPTLLVDDSSSGE